MSFPKLHFLFTIRFVVCHASIKMLCEADACGEHSRPLTWEPDASQRRSIGVCMPMPGPGTRATTQQIEEEEPAKAQPKRKALVARGSVKAQFEEEVGGAK